MLQSPRLPSSSLHQDVELDEYAAEGFKITPLVPMKKWRVSYEGLMRESLDPNMIHDVRISGIWSSELDYFDFDLDLEPSNLARAIANEKWSRDYFKNLEK